MKTTVYYQNLFLHRTYPNQFKPDLINNGMKEIFFRHLIPKDVMQHRAIMKECLDFQEKYNRGFEKFGFENLVSKFNKSKFQ